MTLIGKACKNYQNQEFTQYSIMAHIKAGTASSCALSLLEWLF